MSTNDPKGVLVVASRSSHKVTELRRMLGDALFERGLELLDLGEAEVRFQRSLPEVVEDAPTFAGNAEKKAMAVAQIFGCWALADDSGLCVDALGGAPGVQSARYSGVEGEGRDEANNQRLLQELRGVPMERRQAAFVCALCLVSPGGAVSHVEGRCRGRITDSPRGREGFGYDPLFLTEEPGVRPGCTHAELTAEEKDSVSHRGKALRKMRDLLERLLARG